jgi:UDPglucose 6-dehydrogenase
MENMKKIYQNNSKIEFSSNSYEALKEVDALLILTEWDEFRMPNFEKIGGLMKKKIVIDGRNIWNK